MVLLNGDLLLNDDLLVVNILLLKSHLFELLHRYHGHHGNHSRHLRSHLRNLSRLCFFHRFLRLNCRRFSFNWLLDVWRISFVRKNLLLSFRLLGSVHLLAIVSARLCLPLFLRSLVSWCFFYLDCIFFLSRWLFNACRHFFRFFRIGNGLFSDRLYFLDGCLLFFSDAWLRFFLNLLAFALFAFMLFELSTLLVAVGLLLLLATALCFLNCFVLAFLLQVLFRLCVVPLKLLHTLVFILGFVLSKVRTDFGLIKVVLKANIDNFLVLKGSSMLNLRSELGCFCVGSASYPR